MRDPGAEARTQSGGSRSAGTLLLLAVLAALLGCAGASGGGSRGGSGGGSPEERPRAETTATSGTAGTAQREGEPVGVEDISVRDLVGQMFVVSMSGTEPDYYIEKMIRERNIGGVLLFGYNMRSEAQTRELTRSLQELSMRTEPAVPLFIAVDQEGGEISSAPWVTPQPAAAEIGRRGDPARARATAERIGAELLRAGVNTDLAPVVDTGFGAAIGTRSYGEDPELVAEMGVAAIRGFEAAGVVSSAKHFPNHGPASADSHKTLPVIEHDAETLQSYDLPPFRAAIEAGVPMIMVGHLLYPAIDPQRPASLSPAAIGMLREDLGFEGVVVTDDLAMEGATGGGTPARAAVRAVKAGADLLIVSSPAQQQADAYDAVVAAVESGEVSRARIEASVERVMRIKEGYHLYETGAR